MRAVSAVLARALYDGSAEEPLRDQVVEIVDGRIAGVRPLQSGEAATAEIISADVVAPGFIDLQINGAADVQFNEEPSADAIARIAAGARVGGSAHILPTFITAPNTDYVQAIAAANAAQDEGVPGALGIHLEGPFLSPERPGIHPARYIRPLGEADLANIGQARGVVLVTLAPERQDLALVRRLVDSGVRVFAGHSAAGLAEMDAAIDAGVCGVTHLFNAMSQIAGREPGVVGAALMRPELSVSLIADGHHVHPSNMAMASRLAADRLCLISDAMKTLAGTVTRFDLYGVPVALGDGCLRGPDGTLAGAHLAMDEAVRNAVLLMNVSPGQALRMASANPARALGLDSELGRIAPGYRASLTLLNDDLTAEAVVIDGRLYRP